MSKLTKKLKFQPASNSQPDSYGAPNRARGAPREIYGFRVRREGDDLNCFDF